MSKVQGDALDCNWVGGGIASNQAGHQVISSTRVNASFQDCASPVFLRAVCKILHKCVHCTLYNCEFAEESVLKLQISGVGGRHKQDANAEFPSCVITHQLLLQSLLHSVRIVLQTVRMT